MMTISGILAARDGETISATADESVRTVIARLAEKRIGAVPIVDAGSVVGIFSERDVIYGLATLGADMLEKPVGEVMTSPAITVEPETGILGALSLMTRRRIRHLPVVKGGNLAGFVSIGDLVKQRIDKIEAEADAMRDYIRAV